MLINGDSINTASINTIGKDLLLELISTLTGSSTLGFQRDLLMVLNSSGTLASVQTLTRTQLMEFMSSAQAQSSMSMAGVYGISFTSAVTAASVSQMNVGDLTDFEGGVVWVVNLDSNATSQYEQYQFNSFFTRNGKSYGVAADGIYLLEGDDDAGQPIQALAVLPKSDFGDPHIKRVPNFYLGVSSTNKMLLKVEAGGQTYFYEARSYSEEMATQRVDVGRGLEGNQWRLTLLNKDGCDFDLESIEFTPVPRQRRF